MGRCDGGPGPGADPGRERRAGRGATALRAATAAGDVILVKASRGVELERVVDGLAAPADARRVRDAEGPAS